MITYCSINKTNTNILKHITMLKEPEFRLCPYSDTLFIAKRQNQVFASAEDRIAFHNDQNNFLRKKLSSINKQLLKSYKVADALLVDNKEVIVHRQFLRGKGFSFQMLTHVEKQEDEIVYGLYDISFKKLNDDEYLIKRKK